MKANELMIGDWVYGLSHSPRKVQGLRNYNEENVVVADHWVNCKQLTPIPLTEEILKANADGGSCSFDEFRSLYHLKSNGYHREISIEFDKTWFVPFVEITGMGHTTIKVNMQCVHELQHALRLCGLSDVADNFRIE